MSTRNDISLQFTWARLKMSFTKDINSIHTENAYVFWNCWFGDEKGIRSVKSPAPTIPQTPQNSFSRDLGWRWVTPEKLAS